MNLSEYLILERLNHLRSLATQTFRSLCLIFGYICSNVLFINETTRWRPGLQSICPIQIAHFIKLKERLLQDILFFAIYNLVFTCKVVDYFQHFLVSHAEDMISLLAIVSRSVEIKSRLQRYC